MGQPADELDWRQSDGSGYEAILSEIRGREGELLPQAVVYVRRGRTREQVVFRHGMTISDAIEASDGFESGGAVGVRLYRRSNAGYRHARIPLFLPIWRDFPLATGDILGMTGGHELILEGRNRYDSEFQKVKQRLGGSGAQSYAEHVFITGEVVRQCAVVHRAGMTLGEVVQAAGGYGPRRPLAVRVFRRGTASDALIVLGAGLHRWWPLFPVRAGDLVGCGREAR